ncbi:ABC transporter substrate-binding protein [Pseudaeromonas sp. ZJS20]|uniref:ABC transporter substrate-binding protein n=1 Tax=Pseudaeromonas aegiceratis TaxID=3153928 RepID=UPI00390C5959
MKRLSLLCCSLLLASPLMAARVEVMHWWTSGGEASAVEVIKQQWRAQGGQWQDFAVSGGGGKSAMAVLRSRALAATPPAAAQIKGSELLEWARLGLLRDLDDLAQNQRWDLRLPGFVRSTLSHQGHYVAVPIGIHRVNWLWYNRDVFTRLGLEPPRSWDELQALAPRLLAAGITPLAIGNDPWQLTILFEAIVLGDAGNEFFRRAFINLEPAQLDSPTMVALLQRFKDLRPFVPQHFGGLTWNRATGMVIDGSAAMQLMGDWAKGELTQAGLQPGSNIGCLPAPGNGDIFSYNIDSIAMFSLRDPEQQAAQVRLANLLMTPELQIPFNQKKGSIPALAGLSLDQFDSCARQSSQTLELAQQDGHLVPSLAEGMATSSYVLQAVTDVLSNFFNDPQQTAEQASHQLRRAMLAAR